MRLVEHRNLVDLHLQSPRRSLMTQADFSQFFSDATRSALEGTPGTG
jgi:hypothetical protein